MFPLAVPNPSDHHELAILHRPLFPGTLPEDTMLMDGNRDVDLHRESIWISYTPAGAERPKYQLKRVHVAPPLGLAGLGLGVTQDRQRRAADHDQARVAVHLPRRDRPRAAQQRRAPPLVLGRRDDPLQGPPPGAALSIDAPGARARRRTSVRAVRRRTWSSRPASTAATTSANRTDSTSTTGSTTTRSRSPASTSRRPCPTPARPTHRRDQTREKTIL